MHKTAENWQDFNKLWPGPLNFRMNPAMTGLSFDFPPIEQVIEELRQDEGARVQSGVKGKTLNMQPVSHETFCAMPIDQVMTSPFALAHFSLGRFDEPGRFLHGFKEKVLDVWEQRLAAAGFTWERCYPIIFISGKGSSTNYHMDFSHVMAWQVYGTKRFCGLRDPNQWADKQARVHYKPGLKSDPKHPSFSKHPDIREEHSLCYDMRPGDQLWNVLLTPHWVEAGDEPSMSLNISHGGLRLNGQLSPNEQELQDYRQEHPDQAPSKMKASY